MRCFVIYLSIQLIGSLSVLFCKNHIHGKQQQDRNDQNIYVFQQLFLFRFFTDALADARTCHQNCRQEVESNYITTSLGKHIRNSNQGP